MPTPNIVMSKRFRRSYRKASVSLQRLIEGTVHDLVRRYRSDSTRAKFGYDRLAHLQPQLSLLEVDISGANRMVADIAENEIHLLDVGGHDTVPRYTYGKYQTDKHQKETAHLGFWPDLVSGTLRFFSSNPSECFAQFGNEYSQEWLYYLSAQQTDVLNETLEHVFSDTQGAAIAPVFIVGGPGTGKTSILINLLKQMVELGLDARMLCSSRMKEFICASTPGIDQQLLITDGNQPELQRVDALVVDDPDTTNQIVEQLRFWISRNGQMSVVLGFDPCQLRGFDTSNRTSGLADEHFDRLVEATNANVFGLDECYRQKENVGLATQKALRLLAESSPFLADQKKANFRDQHIGVNSLGHDFSFPNPHGYVQVYTEWESGDGWQDGALGREIARIRKHKTWSHWPSTLVVIDDGYSRDVLEFQNFFSGQDVHCEAVQLSDISSVKGLEYQHLVLFITQATFKDLECGFEGSGQAKYSQYRLMRIPLSRPKDSQVIFVR